VASRWWLLAAPCILIATTLLALNFLGDSLRERFDPARGRA
jgi:ABC-type dipeptide/oligopeptide/nickel transport system permease subunit